MYPAPQLGRKIVIRELVIHRARRGITNSVLAMNIIRRESTHASQIFRG